MGTQLVRTNLGVLGNSTLTERYVRNPELLELPTLVDGDEEVLILQKVYEEGENWLVVQLQGDYEVDWGDGDVTTHASGSKAYKSVNWSGVSSSTLTSGGYRQSIVRITPQAGQQLTLFNGAQPITEDPQVPNSNAVSVKMAGQNFTTLQTAFSSWYCLEDFEFVGSNNFTMVNASQIFISCYALLEVPQLNLDSCISFTSAFYNCVNLTYIPTIDLSNSPLTNLNSSFRNCIKVSKMPVKNTEKVTIFQYTFSGMENMTSIEGITFSAATDLNSTFYLSYNLERIKPLAWPTNYVGSLNSTFNGCQRLVDITPFQTSGCTNFTSTFRNCRKLTDLTWVDMSSSIEAQGVTNFMYSLKKPPVNLPSDFNKYLNQTHYSNFSLREPIDIPSTAKPTRLYYFARSAHALETLPEFDASEVEDIRAMTYFAVSLYELPAYNFSAVTLSDATSFAYGYNLRKSNVYGLTRTHSYQRCQLSREEIVNIFNNLGTASGAQTITVSLNPGSSSVSAGEIAIATGKGWTVTI
jgi:hypothetical protein